MRARPKPHKQSKPQVISVTYFRENLPDLLQRVHLLNHSFVITFHGKKRAKLGPISDNGREKLLTDHPHGGAEWHSHRV